LTDKGKEQERTKDIKKKQTKRKAEDGIKRHVSRRRKKIS
jgi:hypothetical protein